MTHDKGKPYPWHVGTRSEELGNAVYATSADEQRLDAIPEVEEADKIEQ